MEELDVAAFAVTAFADSVATGEVDEFGESGRERNGGVVLDAA